MDCKLITKETDLSNINKMGWDTYLKEQPLDVYKVNGYYHSIGGKWGNNDYWACPRGEKPTYNNLMEFSGEVCNWGFEIVNHNYFKSKWGEDEVLCSNLIIIKRNTKAFYSFGVRDIEYGVSKAIVLLTDIQEHPIAFNMQNYESEIVHREILWKGLPALIESYCLNGNLIIRPDFRKITLDKFSEKVLGEFEDDVIAEDLFASSINWFRGDEYNEKV